jgi:hypothetical protein
MVYGGLGSMLAAGIMAVDASVVMGVTKSAMNMVEDVGTRRTATTRRRTRKSPRRATRRTSLPGNFSNVGF